jgi:hypothetical protein
MTQRKTRAIQTLAENWLAEHGLVDWTIQDATPRRMGSCYTKWIEGLCCFDKKIIFLRLVRLARHPVEYQRAVIRHEVAHAIIGRAHDSQWADCMMRLGASGEDILFDLHHVMHQAGSTPAEDAECARIAFESYAGTIEKLALFVTALRAGEDRVHPAKLVLPAFSQPLTKQD